MKARTLMIQGTASSVGKSLLVAALCRLFRRRGLRVAPFKSQNMSLNAFITKEGHEIGRAQAVQAEAAGIEPSFLMNPVLLKPAADHVSQVIVNGRVRAVMNARDFYAFRRKLRPEIMASFAELAGQYDLIIIEGAGSPAEINLREHDLANMGMAEMADAPVLLVGDIDRGGVFASLYGTVKLLLPSEQSRVKGFIINKFRGDISILEPGLRSLESLLNRPVLGVLPFRQFHIDEEDSLTERLVPQRFEANDADSGPEPLDIVVLRLPRLSNFTDFAVFDTLPGVRLRYESSPSRIGKPDLLILPGSKSTLDDLRFLEQRGLGQCIRALHAEKTPIMGLCGGYQMLGRTLRDPQGVEGDAGEMQGLGLLPLDTVFIPCKRTAQNTLIVNADSGLLRGAKGMRLSGYEMHMGITGLSDEPSPAEPRSPALCCREAKDCVPLGHDLEGREEGTASADGLVAGTYLHGLFDNLEFTTALLANLRQAKGLPPITFSVPDYARFRQQEYDRLADMVEEHLAMDMLQSIIDSRPSKER